MSDSLRPHGLQHARLPCPSLSPKFAQTHVHWVSDAIQLSCSLLPSLLPSVSPSIRVFPSESALHIRWPKYWNFSISHSSEHSGLISFWIDWFNLLAVQGTLKSLLYHHNVNASILWHSAFFLVQLTSVGFPCASAGKESICNAGDMDSIPGLWRSPGEEKGYSLQYSGLENSMDCIVHGVANSCTWLSDFHFHFSHICTWLLGKPQLWLYGPLSAK